MKFLLMILIGSLSARGQLDPRLSVHTLVREDIFAGFLANDMVRFERGEKTLAQLLAERPAARSSVLAWQGGAELYRAVRAHEAGNNQEFRRHFEASQRLFADAATAASGPELGYAAVTGGSMAVFGDRLPATERTLAWSAAYDNYSKLWKQQGPTVEKMPVHHRGELIGGLAQSAQRIGRTEEAAKFLATLSEMLAGTPYEARARHWKQNPELMSRSSLTCQTCHEPGKLENRRAALQQPASK